MPCYCYRCTMCGATYEKIKPMAESWDIPPCPSCRGGPSVRDYPAEAGSIDFAEPADQYSEAAGVHPNQIAEAKARFPHHEFTPDGRMVFHSQHHKDRCLKDLGWREYSKYDKLKSAS